MKRLRIAVAGLTACSGCQLTLLNCEEELLRIVARFDVAYFPLACSPAVLEGHYDAALVEGCISTPSEKSFALELRKRSTNLIALGTCAAWGGIPAMMCDETDGNVSFAPLHTIVPVDATLYGCPLEKTELLNLLSNLLQGVLPAAIDYPVCTECIMRENGCLLTGEHQLCLGALTRGGCNARCPSLSVVCEGCRGPVPEANLSAALASYADHGFDIPTVSGRLHRFYPGWKP